MYNSSYYDLVPAPHGGFPKQRVSYVNNPLREPRSDVSIVVGAERDFVESLSGPLLRLNVRRMKGYVNGSSSVSVVKPFGMRFGKMWR